MKVLVLSDSHDRRSALRAALKQGEDEGCQAIIFCGDSSSAETFSLLVEDGRPVYAVLGNIEYGTEEITKQAQQAGHVFFNPQVLTATINHRTIAVSHYPKAAETLASQGKYDAVFYGHTHEARVEYRGLVLIANPGEISGHITNQRTIGIYNAETNSFKVVPLEME